MPFTALIRRLPRPLHSRPILAALVLVPVLSLVTLLAWLVAPCLLDDPLTPLLQQSQTRTFLDDNGLTVRLQRTYDYQWRFDIPLSQISPFFINAIIATEDAGFLTHSGVSYTAILRALKSNLTAGRVVSGASTITMQLAALPFAGKHKSLPFKIRQALQARRLEQIYSKQQILTEYVNRIPFGGKIYGIQAASIFYFGKDASKLSPAQATLLAGIPQRPNAFRPDRHPERARKRQLLVIKAMLRNGDLSPAQAAAVAHAPLNYRDFKSPSFFAEHAHSDYDMFLNLAAREAGSSTVIHTSLNTRHHELLLKSLRLECKNLPDVNDAAGIIIDSKSSRVLALVGTLDFYNPVAGQFNAATAPRSAGSTLKPFIYAEAINGGIIAEATVLQDAPIQFGPYSPANYDGSFMGKVTASDALALSLNTPAIRLLATLGIPRIVERFVSLNLLPQSVSASYIAANKGLTIALGTSGHSLLNLTNAYTVLARDGSFITHSFLKHPERPHPTQIFSPATADMCALMLRSHQMPNATIDTAWKTGTSNGYHDAWCFAFTPDFTVGIWFGNKSGRASSFLVGTKTAAPAAAKIISALHNRNNLPVWNPPELHLKRTRLCAKSGLSPSHACKLFSFGWTSRDFALPKCTSCANPPRQSINITSPKPVTYITNDPLGLHLNLTAKPQNVAWYADGLYIGNGNTTLFFTTGYHKIHACSLDNFTQHTSVTFNITITK